MLPINWHRHFANKQALGNRERRLLYFAGGASTESTDPEEGEENEDPLATNEAFAGAGINPDGTLQENPENNVDENVDNTRGAAEDVMNNPGSSEKKEVDAPAEFPDLLEKIQATQQKLHEITRNQTAMRSLIIEKVPNKADREVHMADLGKINLYAEMAIKSLSGYEDVALCVQRFTSGAISPEDFEKEFSSLATEGTDSIEGFDANDIAASLAAIDEQGIQDPDRSKARDEIFSSAMELGSIQEAADFIATQLKSIDEAMEPMDEYADELENFSVSEDEDGFSWSRFWGKTTSINNIIRGTKKYIEAISKSYEEWNQQKEASIAQGIGGALAWIPLGKQTESVLDRQTEQLNDEIRDAEKNRLEKKAPSFSQIADMLNNAKTNPHIFRAVLEYAAERAWLYDYDTSTGVVFGINIANHLPETWNEQNKEEYLREINNKNSSGESSEKQRGYDLVDTDSDIEPMIETLHDELTRGNYWASHGILKRAMEKGKEGETSTWISVTIFRYLRDNPDVKKYFPIKLLDDLGNIGIGHPAWTSTYFKFNRKQITRWQGKGDDGKLEDAGDLANVISIAEKHIIETGFSGANKKDLDRYVAQILASQTITVNGVNISIFDSRYDKYRNALGKAPTNVDPKLADEDFFNDQNRGSEMILLGNQSYNNLLRIESFGSFTDQYRSNAFLEQLIFRANDLRDQFGGENSEQYINHVTAAKSKLNHWLITNANDSRSAEKIGNNTFPNSGKLIFLTLIKEKLVDLKTVLSLSATTLGPIVVRQILEDSSVDISGPEIMKMATSLKKDAKMDNQRFGKIEQIVSVYNGRNQTRAAA